MIYVVVSDVIRGRSWYQTSRVPILLVLRFGSNEVRSKSVGVRCDKRNFFTSKDSRTQVIKLHTCDESDFTPERLKIT